MDCLKGKYTSNTNLLLFAANYNYSCFWIIGCRLRHNKKGVPPTYGIHSHNDAKENSCPRVFHPTLVRLVLKVSIVGIFNFSGKVAAIN